MEAYGYEDIALMRRWEADRTERDMINRAGSRALSSFANSGAGSSLMSMGGGGGGGGMAGVSGSGAGGM
jgi:hypothetical protein